MAIIDRQPNIRVLMFPWLAHGHISPFLELAKKLTQRNFHIYFCSTPINLYSIKRNLDEKYSSSIQLVELQLPSLPEFPPHYHTTKDLPPHLMSTLKQVLDSSGPNLFEILKTLKPDLLIYDCLMPFVPKLASSLNIPSVNFPTNAASMISIVVHAIKNPKIDFPFQEFNLRGMSKIFDALNFSSNGHLSDNERIEQCIKQSRDIILVKTFRELEGKYLDYLATLLNKKIVPVGPLVQDPYISGDSKAMEIMKWLDKKKQSSTILVSFGSEYYLSKQEREELAYGLELSNVNFIWVLRFPAGEKNKKINLEEELPLGFMERVKNRGFIIENWAPQAMILKHCSIGGFVSHCGWSSIMESMKFGVPIIAIPKQLDQPMNARLVESVGVGLDVKRDEDGNYGREEIAGAIKVVVANEEEEIGGKIRRKAKEISQYCIEKKGEEEIDELVHELVKLIS